MTEVHPLGELRRSATTSLFEGGEEIGVSIFVTRYEQGQGPDPHFHPYPEAFVVETGTAAFTVDGVRTVVGAGHVVTVPARAVHSFKCEGHDALRVVAVHPSPRVEQTNL